MMAEALHSEFRLSLHDGEIAEFQQIITPPLPYGPRDAAVAGRSGAAVWTEPPHGGASIRATPPRGGSVRRLARAVGADAGLFPPCN